MTNEQVVLLVEGLSLMSALDSFFGAFVAFGAWRCIDWFFKTPYFRKSQSEKIYADVIERRARAKVSR